MTCRRFAIKARLARSEKQLRECLQCGGRCLATNSLCKVDLARAFAVRNPEHDRLWEYRLADSAHFLAAIETDSSPATSCHCR